MTRPWYPEYRVEQGKYLDFRVSDIRMLTLERLGPIESVQGPVSDPRFDDQPPCPRIVTPVIIHVLRHVGLGWRGWLVAGEK